MLHFTSTLSFFYWKYPFHQKTFSSYTMSNTFDYLLNTGYLMSEWNFMVHMK